MKRQISDWLNFLGLSLSLFTTENRISVFHPTHTPCSNTAGDILFELNLDFHRYLSMIVGEYMLHSDSHGDDGELDFVFRTFEKRVNEGLKHALWVVEVTEVEKMPPVEMMIFVCDELSRAIDYFREFFDPEMPLWDVPDDEMDRIPVF